MKESEIWAIIIAIVVLGIVAGFKEIVQLKATAFAIIVGFAAIIIIVNILFKK